jgi:hypothetical protein
MSAVSPERHFAAKTLTGTAAVGAETGAKIALRLQYSASI